MPDEVSLLRHSIRGTINALSLGVSAMDTGLTRDEAIEFLDYIIQATDQMSRLIDQYEALPDSMRPVAQPVSQPVQPTVSSGAG